MCTQSWEHGMTCPCSASVPDEPGCLERGPWHLLKSQMAPHWGTATCPQPCQHRLDPVLSYTSCSQAGEQPKLGAQAMQQGCDGEAVMAELAAREIQAISVC